MQISAIRCLSCKDIIFSRVIHDHRYCSCGKCFIDGGFDYVRIGGDQWEHMPIEVKTTKKELFDDWNTGADKYGLFKWKT